MITDGEAAIPLETTLHAFRNQEKTKQRSTIERIIYKVLQDTKLSVGLNLLNLMLYKISILPIITEVGPVMKLFVDIATLDI